MDTKFKNHWGDNGLYSGNDSSGKSLWDKFTERLDKAVDKISNKIDKLFDDNDRVNFKGKYERVAPTHSQDNTQDLDKWNDMQKHFNDNGFWR